MDLSALIFVALAVAWAAYLIPKALRHHEEGSASRGVEGFSARLRVLARREPVDSRSARLVVSPGAPTSTATPVETPDALETDVEVELEVTPVRRPVPPAVRRAAAARAARRRMRVVQTILAAGVVVAGLAVAGVVGWVALAGPGVVLVAWLVACRLMVKNERAAAAPSKRLPLIVDEPAPKVDDADPQTEEIAAVHTEVSRDTAERPAVAPDEAPEPTPAPSAEQAGWDPVPTTLPTYVGKAPAARRTVRTIDLDSTGVWTSGRLASDSELAREADAERQQSRGQSHGQTDEERRRASGS